MKKTIFYPALLFVLSININAQETNTFTEKDATSNSSEKKEKENLSALEKDICHAELSKAAYYEALIRQNNFDIKLKKNTNGLVLRNTEEIIKRNQYRVSYSR